MVLDKLILDDRREGVVLDKLTFAEGKEGGF